MKTLIATILLSLSMYCGHCEVEHNILEIGRVTAIENNLISIEVNKGHVIYWYLEDLTVEIGSKVAILGCTNLYPLK